MRGGDDWLGELSQLDFYSPPGTSYTIVDTGATPLHPRATYLGGSSGVGGTINSGGKKRAISPEQVLQLLQSNSNSKHQINKTAMRSPPNTFPIETRNNFHNSSNAFPIQELSTRTVHMTRDPPEGTHGFGICVKGGKDSGTGVYISRVEEGSVAERAGLRPGDSILEVNGTPFSAVSHEEALKMLKSCRHISMTVRSPTLPAGVGTPFRQTCSWMDRHGRPVSPPRHHVGKVRRVDLLIEPGQSLGLMIRGGIEYSLGIFVTGVDKGSVADQAGLQVGDQILEVNNHSFLSVTHDEAVAILKWHKRMSLLVRDVGKVPHACTAQEVLSPRLAKARESARKWAAALQMVEEKAKCLLARSEFAALCYYTDEYAAKAMPVEAYVQVVLELLNTAEKYTLLTELREIIAVEDRQRFDELVYKRPNYIQDEDNRTNNRRNQLDVTMHDISQEQHEDFHSPSDDSGVGLDKQITDRQNHLIKNRPSSAASTLERRWKTNDEQDFETDEEEIDENEESSGYLGSFRSSLGGWTQRVKSWYWGRPLELAHKLSRSFDTKDALEPQQPLRRHQSMTLPQPNIQMDSAGNLRVSVPKVRPILGIAIEGGANTKHPLPRIINVHEDGAAHAAGGLQVGQLILEVDDQRVEGLQHEQVARLIAESFARTDRPSITFLVVEAKKSNLEPKPTALVFLEA